MYVYKDTKQSTLPDLRYSGISVTRVDHGFRNKDCGKRFFPKSQGNSLPTKILTLYFMCSTQTL